MGLLCIGAVCLLPLGCDKQTVKVTTNGGQNTASYQRIINGNEVDTSDSPQLIRIELQYKDGTTGICSGSVIGPQEIVSATHCFLGNPQDVRAFAGMAEIEVLEVVAAPQFRDESDVGAYFNDVALLRTTPHNLPAFPVLVSQPITSGAIVQILGFGVDSTGLAGQLKSGVTRIEVVTENHLMSAPYYGDGSNPCYGDSGGPALVEVADQHGNKSLAIAGIVSSGTQESCLSGDVTLFTALYHGSLATFLLQYAPNAVFL